MGSAFNAQCCVGCGVHWSRVNRKIEGKFGVELMIVRSNFPQDTDWVPHMQHRTILVASCKLKAKLPLLCSLKYGVLSTFRQADPWRVLSFTVHYIFSQLTFFFPLPFCPHFLFQKSELQMKGPCTVQTRIKQVSFDDRQKHHWNSLHLIKFLSLLDGSAPLLSFPAKRLLSCCWNSARGSLVEPKCMTLKVVKQWFF